MHWETAATFDNAVAAELAKNLLEGHGIQALLSDEETVAIAWSLSNAVGGIKLLVPAEALGRAEYLLEHKAAPPANDEEIAEAIAANPEVAAQFAGPPEPFDDTATDLEVDRVLKATVFALLFVPVQLYTLYRLWMLRYAEPPVRPRDYWKIRLAYALSLPLWFAVIVPVVLLLGRLDNSGGVRWQNVRFGGLGQVELTVDFPGEYGYDLRDEQTVLGPASVREFGVSRDESRFFVTIKSLPKDWTSVDPAKSLKDYVDDVERNNLRAGIRFLSSKAAAFDGYPGQEIIAHYVDKTTRQPRVVVERTVLIDRHIVILSAYVPADQADGKIPKRFFRSAKIQ